MKIIAENSAEERLLERIVSMSHNMAKQDNRSTNFPIWTILDGEEKKLTTGYGAGFFLTEAAAAQHIESNDYHYDSPVMYVDSVHRNYELHDLIHLVLLIGEQEIPNNHYGRLR